MQLTKTISLFEIYALAGVISILIREHINRGVYRDKYNLNLSNQMNGDIQ